MQQSVDENPPLTTKLLPLKAVNSVGFLVSIGLGVFYLVGGALLVPLALFVLALFFILNFWVAIQKEKEGPQVNELHKKLHEKEFLLKEVHHRVKNNLQTVSSLLSLQSRSIADKKIKGIIRSSQHRVVSMSMVHEMLYKRDDYTSKI